MEVAKAKANIDQFREDVKLLLESSQKEAPGDALVFGACVIVLIDEALIDLATPDTQQALYFLLLRAAIDVVGVTSPYGQELKLNADLVKVMTHTKPSA